jgi:hypothetical protein
METKEIIVIGLYYIATFWVMRTFLKLLTIDRGPFR